MRTDKVIQVGNLFPDLPNFKNRTAGRVYSERGISPTINCCGGGNREPMILEDYGDLRIEPEQG